MTVRAAEGEGKWVGVCGGIAGDPRGALILAGLGVHELSLDRVQLWMGLHVDVVSVDDLVGARPQVTDRLPATGHGSR